MQKNYFRINCMDQTELETVSELFLWKIAKATMNKNKLAIFIEKVLVM